ncbi:maleylpyruvate isomerase [Actinoalloteichus hoggarensis]|uniref:Mycothiol-dependent maleylpyruvate isomerase n=1 Tax=Actinoalloteichus hoggarensis TaxID=1470176 RepID=A0A221W6H3_9PSEU|nr:maleylpyruvate isomerase family mycothiol-dependent enzyme [Actinoalloteichus hoggarensis]ASO21455.1 mycothiol-dependent maleylpyruvate isomerase [Actinoalloteichus hoggarensis]MBB5922044.1 maleylpyruvate isomerase [Actinoalloteichus hoggarensis]
MAELHLSHPQPLEESLVAPRTSVGGAAASAAAGLRALEVANRALLEVVESLDDTVVSGPSLLPGWSRAHVLTHLARNADGLVNLLTWARTDVEHPMYQSAADRNADIEEGVDRPARLLGEDVRAATERFDAAAAGLDESAWAAQVVGRGRTFQADEIPWIRQREVWIHLVDLDVGPGIDDIPDDQIELMLVDVITRYRSRDDAPRFGLRVEFADGTERTFFIGSATDDGPPAVRGKAKPVLGWLIGRGDGAELLGTLPALPEWD